MPTLGDGIVTRLRTFQKFFEQQELRAWLDQTLDCQSVADAPGVFYVFRDLEACAEFVARRFRRRSVLPRMRVSDRLVAQHRDLLDELAAFLSERGRLAATNVATEPIPCSRRLIACAVTPIRSANVRCDQPDDRRAC
jgi:DNA phosphorothioation-associated putative methyltransferase